MLPTDQQLDLEFWTETGDFDSTELHEVWGLHTLVQYILFSVWPRASLSSFTNHCPVLSGTAHSYKQRRSKDRTLTFIGVPDRGAGAPLGFGKLVKFGQMGRETRAFGDLIFLDGFSYLNM